MWATLYLLIALASASAFYLSSRHQQLCVVSRPRRLRFLAWLSLVLAWSVAEQALGLWSGGFATLTAFMLAVVVLPYLDTWRSVRKSKRTKQEESRHVG